ncbi:MAG: helix-turn-helix domain-containing protein [Bacteroidales bacterium]|nr:helix-turn-helix domain-containing protein [Candidatus Scybalousia scybalohippi]
MGVEATRFAWGVNLSDYKKRSTKRLVLLALADRANKEGICFPSVARISEDTCLDRKTIMSTIQDLISMNILVDTGERKGATMQVRVLQVNMSFKAPVVSVQEDKEESDTNVPEEAKDAVNEAESDSNECAVVVIGDNKKPCTSIEDFEPEIVIDTPKPSAPKQPKTNWIPKHEYAKKLKEQRELEKQNQEFIVPQSMKASWKEGFTRDTKEVVKGIPKGLLSDPRIAKMLKRK